MKELKELENKIVERLQEIREIGDKRPLTTNELNEYAELQKKLRETHNVMIYLDNLQK